ncbi:MAG: ECF-type sigma factor [Planctomycetota bacterium]
MREEANEDITSLIEAAKSGDESAAQQLFSLVYDDLKAIAKRKIGDGHFWGTQTTTLVHETYMRMFKSGPVSWSHRRHFFFAAAHAMHDILVERARRDKAAKRGGGFARVELHENLLASDCPPDLIELSESLQRLEEHHERKANVVFLKFFAGLTHAEIADLLQISEATIGRDWDFAKAWLKDDMSGES